MDGYRCTETGETDVTMSKEEAAHVYAAMIMMLNKDGVKRTARREFMRVATCLRQLGVEL